MRVGAQKGADKLGYEAEAFAIYDTMKYIKPAVHTLCVGTAFGESAMLLAAGTPVRAAHLPAHFPAHLPAQSSHSVRLPWPSSSSSTWRWCLWCCRRLLVVLLAFRQLGAEGFCSWRASMDKAPPASVARTAGASLAGCAAPVTSARRARAQGKRGALPSSTIMLRQPMQRFTQMQASDIDIYRNEMRKTKNEIVRARRACWKQTAR